ncbi:hypothetical protein TNCV_1674511 [Trichonephila clavipes]|nr:hypothetical protein TNCV_1674511 [Trichonephila clavipes]
MRFNPTFTPPIPSKRNGTLLKALTQNNLSKASEYPFTLHTFGRSPRSNDAHFLPNGARSRHTPSSGGVPEQIPGTRLNTGSESPNLSTDQREHRRELVAEPDTPRTTIQSYLYADLSNLSQLSVTGMSNGYGHRLVAGVSYVQALCH